MARGWQMDLFAMMNPANMTELQIEFRGDGPVTTFVAISRACELAAKGADAAKVAEALHHVLNDLSLNGPIPSNEH